MNTILKPGKFLSTRKRVAKKVPVLAVLFVVFIGVVYEAGARSFWQGFFYMFIIWSIVKLNVTLVLLGCWYAHTKVAWIPGTKDRKESYRNDTSYLSSILRSLSVERL